MSANSSFSRLKRKASFSLFPLILLLLGMSLYAIVFHDTIQISSNHTVNGKELPIYCVDTDKPQIALSFDAAWGAEDFNEIMSILKKHNVQVTFFMTGGWVEANPECVKKLVKEGHTPGNHSETHPYMSKLSEEEIRNEIQLTHDKVKKLTGVDMCLFRPPYGDYSNTVITTLEDMNYYTIQWDVDSLDWKDYGVDSIIQTVCEHKNLGNGSIILCHNGAKYTADALDEMITNLKAQGYEFVTIDKLIYTEDYYLDVTGRQFKK